MTKNFRYYIIRLNLCSFSTKNPIKCLVWDKILKIIDRYKKLSLNNKIFYGLTIFSIGLWILVSFGAVLTCLIVLCKSGSMGLNDFLSFIDFGDFFDVLNFIQSRSPYTSGIVANYPPLAYLILYPFCLLSGADGVSSLLSSPRALLTLGLFYVICLTFITILVYKLFKDEEKNKRVLFVFFSMFSFPVLYLLLRANFLLVTIIFVLFFINYYKSENKILRELAILALAIAVATKLYPVFFAILLIREKRFFDCVKAAAYSLILFFLPFLFFQGGLDNFGHFINNLIDFTGYSGSRQRDISIDNSVRILFEIFGIRNYQLYRITGLVVTVLITGFSIVASLFLKKLWKVFLLLSLMCITASTISFSYSLVFLIPSIAFYLKEEKNETDIIFAVLFFVLFSATGFFLFINSFIVLAIQIALIIQAFEVVAKFIKKVFLWAKGLDRKLKFLFVGGLNTILGMGVYFIVLLSFGLKLNEQNADKILIKALATVVSATVGIINSYFWNKYFTFENKEKNLSEKIKFVSVYIVATLLDVGVKAAFSNVKSLNEYLIALIGVLVVVTTTYLSQRYFVFRKTIKNNEKIRIENNQDENRKECEISKEKKNKKSKSEKTKYLT